MLAPWAERLVDLLGPLPGESILDLSADGGMLARRLTRAGATVATAARGRCDAAASLFGVHGDPDPAGHLARLLAAVDPRAGRIAALVQLSGEGSPHEQAVGAALGTAARPAAFSAREVALLAGAGSLRLERLRDVVRFDGVDRVWAALAAERGIEEPLDARRREVLEASLARWIAADGTLRIPVEAACLVRIPDRDDGLI
ncbi:MAG TPA: hypothetical protein VH134_00695 [Candidatus Dormibacteraeota bacterium]|nr:hypothetical protein [Candidatus Dormibacteraeota bacterium]